MSNLKDYFEYEKRNLFADESSQRESFSNILNSLNNNEAPKPIKSPFFAFGFSFIGLSFAALILFVGTNSTINENIENKKPEIVAVSNDSSYRNLESNTSNPVMVAATYQVKTQIVETDISTEINNSSKKAQTKAKISDTINLIASIQSFE